ncbi:hypothetical protein ACJX0J_022432, partial [Zea mays]
TIGKSKTGGKHILFRKPEPNGRSGGILMGIDTDGYAQGGGTEVRMTRNNLVEGVVPHLVDEGFPFLLYQEGSWTSLGLGLIMEPIPDFGKTFSVNSIRFWSADLSGHGALIMTNTYRNEVPCQSLII